jgi:alpha-tubulin suppressor-like RCC1 family protein
MQARALFCGSHPGHLGRWLMPVLALSMVAVILGCRDDAESPTEPAPAPALATTAASALAFSQVSAGTYHTCGVTTDSLAYCWGWNYAGQLGNGTLHTLESCYTEDENCSTRPVAVLGGLRFRNVSAGGAHTCGVTTDRRAYCWGDNTYGQLGDGTRSQRLTPVAVLGGRRFRQVSAGGYHTCGVTTDSLAYCWGLNDDGQLGDGTRSQRLTPVAVLGGRRFRQVSAGDNHTCGVTTANVAFCWGRNNYGQLGDSTEVARRLRPSRVAGARQFRQLDAGGSHTCGVTTGDRAFCWGDGGSGQLGTGQTSPSLWPRAVAGGLSFSRVTAGSRHTCGETTGNRAYCWGYNYFGQLGNGTDTGPETCTSGFPCSTRPVAVGGGLYFSQVSAGGAHTCGLTPGAVGYCWGGDEEGQVGDGEWMKDRLRPTAVVGP